jgi:hypothetical protein
MACPNFKNGPKNGLGPLGVNFGFYKELLIYADLTIKT